MYNITDAATQLQEAVAWQETPVTITAADYVKFIIRGIRKLFIDTGRAMEYSEDKIITQDANQYYNQTMYIDEEEYIMLCAIIEFFRKVQTDVNDMVSYTTDALSVTNSDKPYSNLKNTIEQYDNDRRIIFYKMNRFVLPDAIS